MEFDATSIAVAAAILLPFAIMFAVDRRNRAKQRGQLLNDLKAAALTKGHTLHRHETLGDLVLGLDEEKGVLYFNDPLGHAAPQRVELERVRSCEAHIGMHGKGADATIERVELRFAPAEGGSGASLLLYRAGGQRLPNDEAPLAERWARIVNQRLK
ncbi:MAG: hypothetical protein QY325_06365 [Flavobacteriales bacterium]|nr:MAG: hypothetical protein QY325_06365 [Flavobacteriales bacterium]